MVPHGNYRCLSYTWGEPGDEFDIIVNDQPFRIRRNLHDFLLVARSKSHLSGSLWIDALSINQNDPVEKGHQVQRMGQIYSNAQEVLVWLGERTELHPIFQFSKNYLDTRSKRIPPALSKYVRFYANSYWRRAWVIQEFLLARNIRL
ncbi:heterokaryon incompatibility, partial [Periconia macrospinosa]